jgi:hypothetical protein
LLKTRAWIACSGGKVEDPVEVEVESVAINALLGGGDGVKGKTASAAAGARVESKGEAVGPGDAKSAGGASGTAAGDAKPSAGSAGSAAGKEEIKASVDDKSSSEAVKLAASGVKWTGKELLPLVPALFAKAFQVAEDLNNAV